MIGEMGERGGERCSEETSSRKALGCERKGGREERKGEGEGWRERERERESRTECCRQAQHDGPHERGERDRERECVCERESSFIDNQEVTAGP
jgi:hypothetical protein